MSNNNVQDWAPVYLVKSATQIKKTATPQELQKDNMIVVKKKPVINNPNPSVNLKKVEQGDEDYKIPFVSSETAKKIIAGRVLKKWTQETLAHTMSLPVATIKSIENCTAIEDKQQLQKIANKLGVKL